MSTSLRSLALPLLAVLPYTSVTDAQETPRSGPRRVAVFLYPGVELLDFAGPAEVFAATRGFEVFTVAETRETLTSQGFLEVEPDHAFGDHPAPDILVIPGGGVPLGNEVVVDWVRTVAEQAELTLSVCNGALLLAEAGLLENAPATTHHGSLMRLKLMSPTTEVRADQRFVDNGRIVTAGGVSSGIDGALHVVARLHGQDVARRTARYMEYRWEPEASHAYAASHAGEQGFEAGFRMLETAATKGVEAALELHATLASPPSERDVNSVGYAYLESKRHAEALRVFALNARLFPDSANTWDSLADAQVAAGQGEAALESIRRCLALLEGTGVDAELRGRLRDTLADKLRSLEEAGVDLGDVASVVTPADEPLGWMCPPCGVDCHDRVYERAGVCTVCGMRLITKAQYQERAGVREAGALRYDSAGAVRRALAAGRLTPAGVLASPAVQALLDDPVHRRGVRQVVAENPPEGEVVLVPGDHPGTALRIEGRVVDPADGQPVPAALVYLYHTNAEGRYGTHGTREDDNDNPRLFAWVRTDADGRFVARTIQPASYPDANVPQHVHYTIEASGREPRVAEFLFADDPRMDDEVRRWADARAFPVVDPDEGEDGRTCAVLLPAGSRKP